MGGSMETVPRGHWSRDFRTSTGSVWGSRAKVMGVWKEAGNRQDKVGVLVFVSVLG